MPMLCVRIFSSLTSNFRTPSSHSKTKEIISSKENTQQAVIAPYIAPYMNRDHSCAKQQSPTAKNHMCEAYGLKTWEDRHLFARDEDQKYNSFAVHQLEYANKRNSVVLANNNVERTCRLAHRSIPR